jgi:release factor glutamine methyltransferase
MNTAPCRSVQSLLHVGRGLLREAGLPHFQRDALLLLAFTLKKEKEFVLTHPEHEVSAQHSARFKDLVLARQRRAPIQYLCGVQEFWGREFLVDPSVLIPRPETELIIEKALEYRETMKRLAGPEAVRVADIGTGSGCLAITLALEWPGSRVFAVDCSVAALQTARRNARRLCTARRVRFFEGDAVQPLREKMPAAAFHLVVSNPPYVALKDREILDPQVRDYEPAEALFSGSDGLHFIRRLIPQVAGILVPGGLFLMEIGFGQEKEVRGLFSETEWRLGGIFPDFGGIPRCVLAWRKDGRTLYHGL